MQPSDRPKVRRLISCLQFLIAALALSVNAHAGDLYLNIIWHQHQPLYVDPQTDQLRGPWVRTHATKDYYDMAAMHEDFPEIHATVNLTSSLLLQLQSYYVERLSPFLYVHEDGKRAIRTGEFLAKWKGKTDPWIDLALKPSTEFDSLDVAKLVTESWNAFGISGVQISRFPEYEALRDKPRASLTAGDLTAIKAWFYLAHFDPDFLRGTSRLDVDLADLVAERDGKFYLKHSLTERDANRLVADATYVMGQIIPEHKKLMYDDLIKHSGQLEIITSPFYHPILPLLIDSDIARGCQPNDSLSPRFEYPQDAFAQVARGRECFMDYFHANPSGMWPAEGSVSEAAARTFRDKYINWICSDMHVLNKSTPPGLDVAQAYRVACDSMNSEGSEPKTQKHESCIAIIFRETTLSDHIGFTYQHMDPESAATHFVGEILKYKPQRNGPDRLLTVILDGENAWEWYEKDMDGKLFLHKLYQKLTDARRDTTITCVTPSEYLRGNPRRNVSAHPIGSLKKIDKLWPGSWISANFDTWIGEPEENKAWEYLLQTRRDLDHSGLGKRGWIGTPLDTANTRRTNAGMAAFESMYAAEGSDWFWWYGADQSAPGGDLPFEQAFFSHLRAVYQHMREAGVNIETPDFEPILSVAKLQQQAGGGVMAKGKQLAKVRFICDTRQQKVATAIYIVGNLPQLGQWNPNTVRMYDDGTHGDLKANDGFWTLECAIPVGTEVQYKYTNSGKPGEWTPSEEFSFANRVFTVDAKVGDVIPRADVFGVRE